MIRTQGRHIPPQNNPGRRREGEAGSALIYILIAIALLAALTVSFMQPSGNQTQTNNAFKTVSELQSQVDFIRAAVQECVLSYPAGDATVDNTAAGTMDVGANRRYPLRPDSDHFDTATVTPTTGTRLVRDIRCPGNPGDRPGDTIAVPGNAVNHANIFGGGTGKFLAPPPTLFEDWQWYNGEDGIFFWIETTNSDAFIQSAFDKLEESFSKCEADQINAVSGARALDGAGDTSCPLGSRCFRVWMVMDNVSGAGTPQSGISDAAISIYPDETDCP